MFIIWFEEVKFVRWRTAWRLITNGVEINILNWEYSRNDPEEAYAFRRTREIFIRCWSRLDIRSKFYLPLRENEDTERDIFVKGCNKRGSITVFERRIKNLVVERIQHFRDPSPLDLYSPPRYPVLVFKRAVAQRMKNMVASCMKVGARKQLQNSWPKADVLNTKRATEC